MIREYTNEEIEKLFLEQVSAYVNYWLGESRRPSAKEKLEGLAFSILSILDGGTGLPGFQVIPNPCKEDKKYNKDNGENWFPYSRPSKYDIAGGLHEKWHRIHK